MKKLFFVLVTFMFFSLPTKAQVLKRLIESGWNEFQAKSDDGTLLFTVNNSVVSFPNGQGLADVEVFYDYGEADITIVQGFADGKKYAIGLFQSTVKGSLWGFYEICNINDTENCQKLVEYVKNNH